MYMPKTDDQKREIERLVVKAKKGDTAAFSKIYDNFADEIYRYVFFRVSSEQDAQDLTEMIFLKTWENLDRYSNTKQAFGAWVFRIARNVVIDHYRINKTIEELTEEYIDEKREHNPLHRAENAINNDVLKRALAGLKENYKQIIILKYINELSNVEIAEILKKNEGAVRILQFRALAELRKILEGMGVSGL